MKNKILLSMAAFIVVLTLFAGLAWPALAGVQSWNLDSHNDTDTLPDPSLCQMEQTGTSGDNGQNGEILLTPHTSQVWIADKSATAPVKFGGGDGPWILELVTDLNWDTTGENCIVQIGEWDVRPWIGFRPFTSALQDQPPWVDIIPGKPLQLVITFVWQDLDEAVFKNNYLAIKVTNEDSMDHTIYCGEIEKSSCLTSPGTNPGYPTPDFPPVPSVSDTGLAIMIATFAVLSTVFVIRRGIKQA